MSLSEMRRRTTILRGLLLVREIENERELAPQRARLEELRRLNAEDEEAERREEEAERRARQEEQ
jgi:hypothetical protein